MFIKNKANTDGGGMYNYLSGYVLPSPDALCVTNCVFLENIANGQGGGIYNYGYGYSNVKPQIANCIVWGNTASGDPQIGDSVSGDIIVTYSDVDMGETNPPWGGVGSTNINAEPLFVDAYGHPAGPDGIFRTSDDRLALQPTSPCIDFGVAGTFVPTTDILGKGRFDVPGIGSSVVDMGAYEYNPNIRLLTISSSAYGSVFKPGEGSFLYPVGTRVEIYAIPDRSNYRFEEWTGTAVDAGDVEDEFLAGSIVNMDDDYTLMANFSEEFYVSPPSLYITLPPDSTTEEILTIKNYSGSSVNYTITFDED
jgi:predicted outer membrane repeat protein